MFGIYLPKDISRLAEAKYAPLLNKIKDKRRWSSSVGATLCEHELCFCGISICSSRSQWKPPRRIFIDKIISRFIWQSRRPGVKYKPLQLYKEKTGKRNQGDLRPHFQPSSYCGGSELCISSGRLLLSLWLVRSPTYQTLKRVFMWLKSSLLFIVLPDGTTLNTQHRKTHQPKQSWLIHIWICM